MSETLRQQVIDRIRNADSPGELGQIISELVAQIERLEAGPPLIDGCKVVDRGDGHYSCLIHYRYWAKGSGICPGRTS